MPEWDSNPRPIYIYIYVCGCVWICRTRMTRMQAHERRKVLKFINMHYVLCYYLNIKFLPVHKTCLSRHHHNDFIASDTLLFYMYSGVFKFASCHKVIMVTTGRA